MTPREKATHTWMLQRVRTVRAGLALVLAEVDSIGADLAAEKIPTETAAYDLNLLEVTPLYQLANLFDPAEAA